MSKSTMKLLRINTRALSEGDSNGMTLSSMTVLKAIWTMVWMTGWGEKMRRWNLRRRSIRGRSVRDRLYLYTNAVLTLFLS